MLENKPNNGTLVCITPSTHQPRILDVIDRLVSTENHVGVPGAQTLGTDLATTIVASGTTILSGG
jgi:hypothetical protein